jgi:phosphoribosylformylglycinamidine synthase
MTILHYYRETEPPHSLLPSVKEQLKALNLGEDADAIQSIETESCFNVQTSEAFSDEQTTRLVWLLAETFERQKLRLEKSAFDPKEGTMDLEYGPRMTFASAFSSNAVSICHACGLSTVDRLERSKRFRFTLAKDLTPRAKTVINGMLHDRMTEEQYKKPISTFDVDIVTEKVAIIPIMEEGRAALEKINKEKGLGFDDFDLDYYTNLFKVCTTHCLETTLTN